MCGIMNNHMVLETSYKIHLLAFENFLHPPSTQEVTAVSSPLAYGSWPKSLALSLGAEWRELPHSHLKKVRCLFLQPSGHKWNTKHFFLTHIVQSYTSSNFDFYIIVIVLKGDMLLLWVLEVQTPTTFLIDFQRYVVKLLRCNISEKP